MHQVHVVIKNNIDNIINDIHSNHNWFQYQSDNIFEYILADISVACKQHGYYYIAYRKYKILFFSRMLYSSQLPLCALEPVQYCVFEEDLSL